jgi:hypothetical protein
MKNCWDFQIDVSDILKSPPNRPRSQILKGGSFPLRLSPSLPLSLMSSGWSPIHLQHAVLGQIGPRWEDPGIKECGGKGEEGSNERI